MAAQRTREVAPLKSESARVRVSLILDLHQRVRLVALTEGESVVIGRGQDADVSLPDEALSRRHARLTLVDDEVRVEDLSSTNGTMINNRRVSRATLHVGDTMALGAVTASLHVVGGLSMPLPGVHNHQQFIDELAEAIRRAKRSGDQPCVVMVRALGPLTSADAWFRGVRGLLGPRDLVALHGPTTMELLLPLCTTEEAQRLADKVSAGVGLGPRAACGLAVFPRSAGTCEDLYAAMREAVREASELDPVRWARERPGMWRSGGSGPEASGPLLASTPTMQALYDTVARVARTNLPVLITGETGVGKEVVARAIHDASERRSKSMLCVNCGAIPESLIESTLFGHEKGAYTGADQRTKGVFEEAAGGTVLLDEVGEISPTTQTALLRVLETKNICRLGSQRPVAVDVRVLAATNRDLEAMCEAGTFRLDLLFRLNAMTLRVPPLRERIDEVEALARHFLEQANHASQCRVDGITRQVMTLLKQYSWPGNIRELRNVIDHAVVVAGEGEIKVEHLPGRILSRAAARRAQLVPTPPPSPRAPAKTSVREPQSGFKAHVRQVELALIGQALAACDWNKAEGARRLRIPLRTLKDKVRQGELAAETFDETGAQETIDAFERVLTRASAPPVEEQGDEQESFKDRIRRYEEVLIREALEGCAWNKSEASRRLCIPLRTLKDKLAAFEIQPDEDTSD